jgi:hypothetical protein
MCISGFSEENPGNRRVGSHALLHNYLATVLSKHGSIPGSSVRVWLFICAWVSQGIEVWP